MLLVLVVISLYLSTEVMQQQQHNNTAHGGPPRKVQGMLCLCRTSAGHVWKGSTRHYFHPTPYLEVQSQEKFSWDQTKTLFFFTSSWQSWVLLAQTLFSAPSNGKYIMSFTPPKPSLESFKVQLQSLHSPGEKTKHTVGVNKKILWRKLYWFAIRHPETIFFPNLRHVNP